MTGRRAMYAYLFGAAVAAGPGCASSFGLEVRDRGVEELEFIDEGIAAAFQAAETEPPLDDQTLAKRLAGADREAFEELRREARDRLLAPGTPATHLAHEAAHLATGNRYPHTLDNCCECMDDPDFVVRAGTLTAAALYWQLWLPEARRIDGAYFGTE